MSEPKVCIINASIGGWYPRGTDRLVQSLWRNGWAYDIVFYKDEPINEFYQPGNPYTIKAAAWMNAVWLNYDIIIWMDCSVYAIDDPNILVRIIEAEGGYFLRSGFQLSNTATDSDLKWAKMTRDTADRIPELWSCMFGVDMRTQKGKKFSEVFIDGCKSGVFNTSREHAGQSKDPRFKFGRQDQVACTVAFHKAGFEKLYHPGIHLSAHTERKKAKDSVFLFMRGL